MGSLSARARLAPFACLALGCTGPRVTLAPWPYEEGLAPPTAFGGDSGADIAILEDLAQLRFNNPDRPREGYTLDWIYRFRVLSPAGRYLASRRASLGPGDRLESLSARSYAPGDPASLRRLRREDVRILADASDAILLYQGAATAAFEVPGVDVGDIVEIRGRLRRAHVHQLPTWRFDALYPVRKSRLVVHLPSGWELAWASRRGPKRVDFRPRRYDEGEGTALVFEAEQLAALEPEPQAPSLGAWTLQLAIRKAPGQAGLDRFGTWPAIAQFYRRLVEGKSRLSDEDWHAITRELGSKPSPEALYGFVRDRVRYVALFEDNLGGYQPHPAGEVLAKRFGDCKDQSTLLLTLLERIGVTAHPVLVGTRDRVFFDPEFPSVSAFNHVVVAVPRKDGGYIYLDPTDIEGEFGILSHYLQGQGALVIMSETSELLTLAAPRPESHVTRAHYRLESPTRISAEIELTGSAAWGLEHLATHDRARLEKVVTERFLGHLKPTRLELELQGSRGDRRLRLRAEVAPWFGEGTGFSSIPLAGFLPEGLIHDPVLARRQGVRLPRRGLWAVTIELPSPPGEVELPGHGEARAPQAQFRWTSNETARGARFEAELRVTETIVAAGELAELRRVDRALSRARSGAILIGRAP